MKPPVERLSWASASTTPLANSIAITITTEIAISSVVRGSGSERSRGGAYGRGGPGRSSGAAARAGRLGARERLASGREAPARPRRDGRGARRARPGRARGGLLAARAVRAHAAVGHARAGGRLDPARLRAGARVPRRLPDRLPAAGVGRAEPAPARRAHGRRRAGRAAVAALQRAAVLRHADRRASARSWRRGRSCSSRATATYTVTVSVGPSAGGADGCLSGPSSTGSFSAGARVAPALSGAPLSFRATPPLERRFNGVRAADPPGGQADIRCALDARVQADGSVDRRRRRARATGHARDGARGRVPAARRLDVRRPRHRRGRRRGVLADGLRRARGPRR